MTILGLCMIVGLVLLVAFGLDATDDMVEKSELHLTGEENRELRSKMAKYDK